MSTKPCIAQGKRECIRGFHKDLCLKCTQGSVNCNMCHSETPSFCIYCTNGRKECDDCYGLGHVRRICQPCIKEHYRRQNPKAVVINKVKSQIELAQGQFSRSTESLARAVLSHINSSSSLLVTMSPVGMNKRGHKSESDVTLARSTFNASTEFDAGLSDEQLSSSRSSSITSATFKTIGSKFKRYRNSYTESSEEGDSTGKKTHHRKWSWSSFNSIPTTPAAA
ncbi:hypothetical protein EDD11_000953 [Mortierella claussenii]|nr:hypothetical protein EDD11_000953 [Mortierella claussenii]